MFGLLCDLHPLVCWSQGSGYSLRVSKGSLYRVSPDEVPSKCWGWSNLVPPCWTSSLVVGDHSGVRAPRFPVVRCIWVGGSCRVPGLRLSPGSSPGLFTSSGFLLLPSIVGWGLLMYPDLTLGSCLNVIHPIDSCPGSPRAGPRPSRLATAWVSAPHSFSSRWGALAVFWVCVSPRDFSVVVHLLWVPLLLGLLFRALQVTHCALGCPYFPNMGN